MITRDQPERVCFGWCLHWHVSTSAAPELSEPDERVIRHYVNSQSPDDDQVTLVQAVGSQRIIGRRHDLYDLHCEKSRWWVITDPTNLYGQEVFPELEQALIFHVGLTAVMAERSRQTLDDPEAKEHVSASWRRFSQAIDAMNGPEESEDFQAVGVKCRDALMPWPRKTPKPSGLVR